MILAAIRALESGGDYTAAARSSTASGAYQFLDSTWGGYGGYARALDAPPPVQDAKAAEWAAAILARNAGDVTAVPVSWYIGHVPVGDEWDRIPPYPGNTLTPRQYQQRWMAHYAELLDRPSGRQHVDLDPGRRRQHLPHRRSSMSAHAEDPPSCSPEPTTSSPTPPGGQPPPTTTPATAPGSHPSRHRCPRTSNPSRSSLVRGAPPRTWPRVRAGCRRPRFRHGRGRYRRRHRGRGRYRATTWP